MNAPLREYTDVRSDIRDGDVLLYTGRSAVSRWIRHTTGSKYSHAGIAFWWHGRLTVLEAVRSGVVATLLSRNVAHYNGGVELFQCAKEIDDAYRAEMVRFAQDLLGNRYSIWKALVVFFYLTFNWKRDTRDKLRRTGSLFCSHFVAQVYTKAGLDLKKDLNDRFMSPKDIADSPLLERIAVLKHEDGAVPLWDELREPTGSYGPRQERKAAG
jgi:uncharacterized protein YycO